MNTPDDFLDSSLRTLEGIDLASPEGDYSVSMIQLEEGAIDPRLKLISHSSRTLLHKCPRKYQLYRLGSQDTDIQDISQGVTFAYGTAVGVGIQSVLENKTEAQVMLDIFLAWDVDLLDCNDRQKKSFWEVVFAIQKFTAIREAGFLSEYELVYYEGAPAIEFSFRVLLPDGFYYRGFVDAVLQHKTTGEVVVLEAKTSSGQPNPAYYKNSGQAIGYSVVLDILFPSLSSYSVLYLVYYTKGREYKQFTFDKSLLQRALWLQDLLIDSEHIKLYESYGSYPMHGESCFDFFRECDYMGLCTLSTANLTTPLTVAGLKAIEKREEDNYMFTVDFYKLVEAQLDKGEE